jgi:hypothetical protein
MPGLPDKRFMEWIADEVELVEPEVAPSRLKAKVYSALVVRQAESGPLMSLTETKACGHELCVFEKLVQIAPVGESFESKNFCRFCHARVLAEHIENATI